jgi:hypothetical protein
MMLAWQLNISLRQRYAQMACQICHLKDISLMDTAPPDAQLFLPDFPELGVGIPSELVEAIRHGLPAGRFDVLQSALSVSSATLADVLNISPSTLSRRRRQGTFE